MIFSIDNIDMAVAHRNHMRRGQLLRKAALTGLIDLSLFYEGDKINVFSVICADVVRAAVAKACDEYITEKEEALRQLGVSLLPDEALAS